MDNGPRRHDTFSFFVTEEQAEVMYNAICLYQAEVADLNSTPTYKVAVASLRQKIVNLRDAIKRRKKKENQHV
jgi:hypothetical protein